MKTTKRNKLSPAQKALEYITMIDQCCGDESKKLRTYRKKKSMCTTCRRFLRQVKRTLNLYGVK